LGGQERKKCRKRGGITDLKGKRTLRLWKGRHRGGQTVVRVQKRVGRKENKTGQTRIKTKMGRQEKQVTVSGAEVRLKVFKNTIFERFNQKEPQNGKTLEERGEPTKKGSPGATPKGNVVCRLEGGRKPLLVCLPGQEVGWKGGGVRASL